MRYRWTSEYKPSQCARNAPISSIFERFEPVYTRTFSLESNDTEHFLQNMDRSRSFSWNERYVDFKIILLFVALVKPNIYTKTAAHLLSHYYLINYFKLCLAIAFYLRKICYMSICCLFLSFCAYYFGVCVCVFIFIFHSLLVIL